jgi:hypothetical protein
MNPCTLNGKNRMSYGLGFGHKLKSAPAIPPEQAENSRYLSHEGT